MTWQDVAGHAVDDDPDRLRVHSYSLEKNFPGVGRESSRAVAAVVGDGSSRSQAGEVMGLVSRREPLEAFTAVRFEGSAGCEVACSSAADDGLRIGGSSYFPTSADRRRRIPVY